MLFRSYFQKRLEAAAEAPSKQEGGKRSGSCDFEWEPGGRGAGGGTGASYRQAGARRAGALARGGRLVWMPLFGFWGCLEPPSGIVTVGTAALLSVGSTSEGSIGED